LTHKLTLRKKLIPNNRSAHLAIIVGVSGFIYGLIFTIPFPLTKFYATIPPVDYTKLTRYSPAGFIAYVVGICLLFGLYLWAIRLTAPTDGPRKKEGEALTGSQASAVSGRFVFVSSTFLAAISVLSYPLTAIDLFIYAIRTRGWVLYQHNPLATAPAELYAGDPWLGLAGEWLDAPSPYGPVWELLSLGAFYLSGADFLPHLLALKIVAMLAYLGCVWLVYKTIQLIQPAWTIAGTVALAWSPLVLLESVQNGHNDIIMAFFMLAAVWVYVKWITDHQAAGGNRAIVSMLLICFFLALSILVKFVTIIVVPFFLLALAMPQPNWWRRSGVIGLSGLTVTILVVAAMLPFWPGRENWAVLKAGSQAGRSLLALLILGLRELFGLNFAFDFSRNLILVIFALIYLYFLWQTITRMRPAAVSRFGPTLPIVPSFYVLFWYVLLAAPVFHAWYLLWFLPLAPLVFPNRRPFMASTVFSITALLMIPYFETVRVWYPALLENQFIGHLVGIPLLIGPPLLALLWPLAPTENSEV